MGVCVYVTSKTCVAGTVAVVALYPYLDFEVNEEMKIFWQRLCVLNVRAEYNAKGKE